MKTNRLGNSDLHVSEVCLGSMTWGQQNTEAEGHAQLDYAISRGINFIDTAEMYAVPVRAETYGATERIIGSWLRKKGAAFREKVVIATKCAGPSRNAKDVTWVRDDLRPFSRADIRRGVEQSLKRLQTEYIDLYQLHWPARNVPIFGAQFFDAALERESIALEETLQALADEIKAGRVRHIGVSNESPWGLMHALRLSEDKALPRVQTIQNAHNLLNRVFEHGLAEVAYREQVGLLAYSPLAFGHLTGKYARETPTESRFALFPQISARYGKPNVRAASEAYATLAAERGLTPTQLALAFCKSRFFVASTIIGATTLPQLQENIAAFDVSLDAETLSSIDALHLRFTNPAP
jgi:aryl-alcohol dehydrogenase-like predicted oxidoreductase